MAKIFVLVLVIGFLFSFVFVTAELSDDFYGSTCPSAEKLIRRVVVKWLARNPGLGAGLIRMHFHDCFVRGCDGSIMLESPPGGRRAELEHPANKPSLRGFEIIKEAKSLVESACPQIVSCADLLTFAARDSIFFLGGGIDYSVQAGRRDGTISLFDEVSDNLPSPLFDVQQLKESFAKKGLSVEEMVTLSGLHSIGVSHCSSFVKRLYNFNSTHPQDPSMDPSFASSLKIACPRDQRSANTTVPLDQLSPNSLDNGYYQNLRRRRGLFLSDQTLYTSPTTASMVDKIADNPSAWALKLVPAMQKLGTIGALTGRSGEIRKVCGEIN